MTGQRTRPQGAGNLLPEPERRVTIVGMRATGESRRPRVLALIAAALLLVNVGLSIVVVSQAVAPTAPERPLDVVAIVLASAPADDVSASQFCTGVLIARNSVLTAGHCVAARDASAINVILQADNLCSTAPIDGERVDVTEITPLSSGADAAILSITPGAQPHIPVALAVTTPPDDAVALTAWGWGSGSIGGAAPCGVTDKTLETVPLPQCARELRAETELRQGVAESTYFCALPAVGSPNTCLGDSGGPVFVEQNGERRLAGITLSGRGCGAADPGLYLGVGGIRAAVG